jgi:hypothetical protein
MMLLTYSVFGLRRQRRWHIAAVFFGQAEVDVMLWRG